MICVPIVGPNMDRALEDIDACRHAADFIEFRLDLIADHNLPRLIQAAGDKPYIVTNRSKMDGGQYPGNEADRVAILKQAIEQDAMYVDIETSTPSDLLRSVLENKGNSKIILSHHDFTRTDDKIESLYELMTQMPADVLKLSTYAQDLNDNLKLLQLLNRARRDEVSLIAFCMGEKGEISRILSPMYGGWLTFGSLDRGRESAPGQIPATTLKDIYRVNDLKLDSRIFGVIGDPVNKSMGYLIHNRAFQELNLPYVYVPFWAKSVTRFFNAFEAFFGGLSVTMPFKEDIMKQLDRIDPLAEKIGAVNTVVREGSDWVGYNTDVTGALEALNAVTELKGKKVLIIGAGGTAKAIGYGVGSEGATLTLTYNRNKEKAEALAQELNAELISVRDVDRREVDVLINCSPAGMTPNTQDTPYPARLLKPGMVVFDSVYNPMETRLIREAKEKGCTVVPGIELFLNQAIQQLELWTGKTPPRAPLRDVVETRLRDLEAKGI
ncbi:shikimate dehydrogenase [Nitrospina watsonii]|uniref:Multifunctional fusion protein n=1 Tax=Nitrospina watsonii TaxID=1323948 RepID=A0ABM9HB76_9BACT|nr:shikimate dehydrogenase [Nitrospina watsonii]CAI2717404.1 3-dehydroquinate dehydratase,Shikimate dehydrogenase (NADP(+)) [Nitrospina watsonii]